MTQRPRVFIIQETPKIRASSPDLLPALEYGELVVLLEHGQGEELNGVYATNRMLAMLADFSDEDFLLLLGNPVCLAIAGAVAAAANRGRFKALKWDKRHSRYMPVTININKRVY